jgi:hypothetical protein
LYWVQPSQSAQLIAPMNDFLLDCQETLAISKNTTLTILTTAKHCFDVQYCLQSLHELQ